MAISVSGILKVLFMSFICTALLNPHKSYGKRAGSAQNRKRVNQNYKPFVYLKAVSKRKNLLTNGFA